MKVAVIVVAPLRTKVQTAVPAHPAPDQPMKSEPTAGVAVNVIGVPFPKTRVHAAPQLMPAGLDVTVPEPVPVFATDTVGPDGVVQSTAVEADALPEPPFELVKLAAFV